MHPYVLGMRRLERRCSHKRRYEKELRALLRAAVESKRCGEHLRVYACQHCGGWHLTKSAPLTQLEQEVA